MFETHTQVQLGTPIPLIQLLWLSWESRPRHCIHSAATDGFHGISSAMERKPWQRNGYGPSKIFHRILDQDLFAQRHRGRSETASQHAGSTTQIKLNRYTDRYHFPTPIPLLPIITQTKSKKETTRSQSLSPLANSNHRTHGLHSCLERMKERLMKNKRPEKRR